MAFGYVTAGLQDETILGLLGIYQASESGEETPWRE